MLNHLKNLEYEFIAWLQYNDFSEKELTLMDNPFNVDVNKYSDSPKIQEELNDLKHDTRLKQEFDILNPDQFWPKYYAKYPLIGEIALRVLIPFTSTYLCECGFHHLTVIKTKYRERLRSSLECCLRCCLSKSKPDFKKLADNMQAHGSHTKWSKTPKPTKDRASDME